MNRRFFSIISALVVAAAGIFCLARFSWGASQGEVLINEVAWMGSASSTADEWLELKNSTDQPIDLTGWTLMALDGSPEIILAGIIPAQGYFLLERTDDESVPGVAADQIYTGALEDQGEFLTLRDSASTTIFSLDASSGWPAGSTITRETMQWTGLVWVTATGTPKVENSAGTTLPPEDEEENPPEESEATSTPIFYPSDIVINEFSADANEGEREWIEFFNNTTATIDLADGTIEDRTGKILDLSGEILAGDFLVFEIPTNKLNNDGDVIILKNQDETIIDQIDYSDTNGLIADKGESVARKIDGTDTDNDAADFALTITPTKDAANIITPRPVPPSSGGGGGGGNQNQNQNEEIETPVSGVDYSNFKIVINEVFPNPAGSDDDDEFIELKNIGEMAVDLKNWFLKDASGKKYVINESGDAINRVSTIDAEKLFLIKRSESKIALNNTGRESVDLYSPDGKIAAHLEYSEKDTEDRSYSRDDKGNYFWTEKITPDAENIIEVKEFLPPTAIIGAEQNKAGINEWIEFDASESVEPNGANLKYLWDWGDGKTSNRETINHRFGQAGEYKVVLTVTSRESGLSSRATSTVFIAAKSEEETDAAQKQKSTKTQKQIILNSLDEIRDLDLGSLVKARGVVAVEPGVLGTQIFYLNGAQIYSYKKDFPNLKLGDYVEVSGEISESGGERRIKTATRDDIKILEQKDAPAPQEISNGDIGEENEGSLVKISGQVLEKKGNYIYLDDGDSEATVYLKSAAGINAADIKAGDFLSVTGLVSQTKTGYRILPRYQSDIVKGEVKGAAENQEINKTKNQEINKYFIAIIVFLMIVIAYLFWQIRKLKKSGWQVVEEED